MTDDLTTSDWITSSVDKKRENKVQGSFIFPQYQKENRHHHFKEIGVKNKSLQYIYQKLD